MAEKSTALQFRQQYFGSEDPWKCIQISEVLDHKYETLLGESEDTYDTSLFPYYAEGPLETPIPSVAEIAAADWQGGSLRKQRIGSYFVKVNRSVRCFQEAENLIYLERNSTVRTPKVYAAFASRDGDPFRAMTLPKLKGKEPFLYYYLVMELIEGDTVMDLEDELDENTPMSRKLTKMLADQLRRLRDVVPENPSHFGRANGGPCPRQTPVFWHENRDVLDYGPFNYEQIVDRMILTAKVTGSLSSDTGFGFIDTHLIWNAKTALFEHVKPEDRRPVLSHLDLNFNNAIAKVTRDESGKIVDIEHAVWVDWEMLTWMPSWYEPGVVCQYPHFLQRLFCTMFSQTALPVMGHISIIPFSYYAECIFYGAFPGL
ncbi:hypothetical protein K491DRAFT_710908 [Lophiostoma macrostomum CBS 122681]|uniref:Aminoglycoside phosphotransferase domain-containing protein n=1 Tax=Lophiostoma macrostomum CBS 122681 TaxID=1314788 RepID=A0A6A6TPD5_9PLEO|nr:hypothetical protein K491DRAFT_710908 [Lophiostoma macrostomum CBS 122681]